MEYLYQAGGERPSPGDSAGPNGAASLAGNDLVGATAGTIFLSGGGQSDLSQDNEPTLYIGPNRTSAIDDIRSVVIYIFIITIFFSFFLILPGIRSDKFPTFLCITTSLVVTSIVLIALFGTTWHVGETPISASYKAFSRDRIQGELSVRIGFQSVNVSLVAHTYYILHTSDDERVGTETTRDTVSGGQAATQSSNNNSNNSGVDSNSDGKDSEVRETGSATATEAIEALDASDVTEARGDGLEKESEIAETEETVGESDEIEADKALQAGNGSSTTVNGSTNIGTRVSLNEQRPTENEHQASLVDDASKRLNGRQARKRSAFDAKPDAATKATATEQEYTIKRVNLDINYNERFYWIEPNQMRQEYRHALERGLPYPILTVVEYLSQDEAGFSWSRQYRAAGYYSSISLWLSICMCILMFSLHCAAPRYGIYAMQALGCQLLFTNLTYALLVPRGDQKLVIPFEGQSLSFRFGWNFWLVLVGGCLSTLVGTLIVIIDSAYPNFIFTTVLDVDFDSQQYNCYKKNRIVSRSRVDCNANDSTTMNQRPEMPSYLQSSRRLKSSTASGPVGFDEAGVSFREPDRNNYLSNNKNMIGRQQHLHKRRVEDRV